MKIAFFRNVRNFDQLRHKTDVFHGVVAECRIIDVIELKESAYKVFCDDFMRVHSFLFPYIYKSMIINDIWSGILVKCGDQSVVVVMNGYQYPRYVGLIQQDSA